MTALKGKLLCGAVGASSGLAGILSLAGCPRGACTSCFGCLGTGAAIVLVALLTKSKGNREENHGMAQDRD